MRVWSVALARVFGVEVRVHLFFPVLMSAAMAWSALMGLGVGRGLVLWCLLFLAVVVREVARGLGSAYYGLPVKGLLLLPTGGVQTFETAEGRTRAAEASVQRVMALVGPVANFVFGLTAAGLILSIAPATNLVSVQWVTPAHLLRAMVWVNLLLGALNLLPVWPLDGGRMVEGPVGKNGMVAGPVIATVLVALGMVTVNFWLIMAGMGLFLMGRMEQSTAVQSGADTVKVREVMLTEYSILSASATLEDAVEQSRHTLQDVFPVVRAGNMVGAVSRGEVVMALERNGNGYVQGMMTKVFEAAGPGDGVLETLRKVNAMPGASSQLVPVVVGEQIVGILTPGNLQRAIGMTTRMTRLADRKAAEEEDED